MDYDLEPLSSPFEKDLLRGVGEADEGHESRTRGALGCGFTSLSAGVGANKAETQGLHSGLLLRNETEIPYSGCMVNNMVSSSILGLEISLEVRCRKS